MDHKLQELRQRSTYIAAGETVKGCYWEVRVNGLQYYAFLMLDGEVEIVDHITPDQISEYVG